ncbi:hypothetical protein CKM354_000555200 [Cercospora kikuchii]|uniref:Uncharacterized protein n=1 Tax=Cercospora kikuchii TaxID=84275 RepID=A0A9P3CJ13_9PEZI|nr:uncharacterized protein CKM354_000555200 [Cercospora kikuchii]GIZ42277.1 hypothetical protein CKM354_000555200 [Cercospora kikuchii]
MWLLVCARRGSASERRLDFETAHSEAWTMYASAKQLTAKDLGLADGREQEDEEALDVLDLPQLHQRPRAETLLLTLADLSSQPASWDATPRNGTPTSPLSGTSTPFRRKREIRSQGIPSYLTKIIASPLAWIEDDEQKECIWEAAAQRLSERSGRTAMGSISRTFVIPLQPHLPLSHDHSTGTTMTNENEIHASTDTIDGYLNLTLREPALTGDDLGLKTWASSYLLAKRVAVLQHTLPRLPQHASILELGAGTGLVGMAAAAILKKHVIMTDLPEIVPNLQHNAQLSAGAIALHGGKVDCAVLDWMQPGAFFLDGMHEGQAHTFPLIFAADPIYGPEHPRLLAQAISYHLIENSDARAVVEMPLRDAYVAEREAFRQAMRDVDLVLHEDGQETGFDDWSSAVDEEPIEITCWWSVWKRR